MRFRAKLLKPKAKKLLNLIPFINNGLRFKMVIFQRFTLKSLVTSIQTRKKVQRPTSQTQQSLGTSRELKILHSETFLDHQQQSCGLTCQPLKRVQSKILTRSLVEQLSTLDSPYNMLFLQYNSMIEHDTEHICSLILPQNATSSKCNFYNAGLYNAGQKCGLYIRLLILTPIPLDMIATYPFM